AARIFEPFFTTKEVGAGTGLGLSIAHSIMTEHKGRIFYETSSLGGAGFALEFPAAEPGTAGEVDGGTVIMTRKPLEDAVPRAGKILVLDDETSIAEMLGEMLGLLGYTPTLSHAPMQAVELIEEQEFDLIISDFRMPGLNGQQFYELVARKKPALARRIVFLTGDMVNEETQDFLKASGSPHLAKPFNLENVKRIVAEVLQANPPREPAAPAAPR
ncbi:MAG TPA: response regulator, partial [Verrucomicrobiae bacterium]|nr:response regulator [Verrucomicrobiae bacterium]